MAKRQNTSRMNIRPTCAHCGDALGKHRIYMLTAAELLAEEAASAPFHNDCVGYESEGIRYAFAVQINTRTEPMLSGGSVSLRSLPQCAPVKAWLPDGTEAGKPAISADLDAALDEALALALDEGHNPRFEKLMHERAVKWKRILAT